jgi:thioredoxin 1
MLRILRYILLLAAVLSLFLMVISCQEATPPSAPDLASIPLEQALSSGLPTLAEFGRGVCVPCKAMKPILEELATEYEGKLNVVIVEIDDHMDQTRQYEIMVIPTQIFFDSKGNEVIRHIGFWPKEEIIAQLKMMGIE